jgi:tRNA A37 methylthiotransferase MiaB
MKHRGTPARHWPEPQAMAGGEHELPSVAFLILGCKTNQCESQAMVEELASRDFRIVSYQGEFCAKMEFSRMHVFNYLRREGTRAANLPDQISNSIKTKLAKELLNLAKEQFSIFSNRFLGRRVLVLVERINDNGYLEGLTDSYIRTLVKGPDRLINEIVEARITKIGAGYVIGELIKEQGTENKLWEVTIKGGLL